MVKDQVKRAIKIKIIVVILSIMLTTLFLPRINSTVYVSKPLISDDTGITTNESYAYDSSITTYAYMNDSNTGNFTMRNFDVGSHSNSEDIKKVNLIIRIETDNFTNNEWEILYSEDGGLSWNVLKDYSNENLTEQELNYTLEEKTDGDWTWNEISGDLWIRIVLNKSIEEGSWIKIYDTYINVTVDDNPPTVVLIGPINNYNTTNETNTFEFNVTDELSGIENCSLYINEELNNTNDNIIEGAINNITSNLSEGEYTWEIRCYDNSSAYNLGISESRVIRVDKSPPEIMLISPENAYIWNESNNIIFEYETNDTTDISNCSLWINGSIYQTQESEKNKIENFTQYLDNGDYEWWINCTDILGFSNISEKRNLTVDVDLAPIVRNISIIDSIELVAGGTKLIICNTTVEDPDGATEIDSVEGILYKVNYEYGEDNGSNHYTNTSCQLINSGTTVANYSCGFNLKYYAEPGEWKCKIIVKDIYGLNDTAQQNTSIKELFAADITPLYIDYGDLRPGYNSTVDQYLTISNKGNKEIDIAVTGYAISYGDGYAMICDRGNITINYERYSLQSGLEYGSMSPLTTNLYQIDEFNLEPRTDNSESTKNIYWKLGMPKGVKGNCSGYVKISIVPS